MSLFPSQRVIFRRGSTFYIHCVSAWICSNSAAHSTACSINVHTFTTVLCLPCVPSWLGLPLILYTSSLLSACTANVQTGGRPSLCRYSRGTHHIHLPSSFHDAMGRTGGQHRLARPSASHVSEAAWQSKNNTKQRNEQKKASAGRVAGPLFVTQKKVD